MLLGLEEYKYWKMTVSEVIRYINISNKKIRIELKEKASFYHNTALTIINGVGVVLSGKGSVPKLYDIYPDLFEDERQQESITNFLNFAHAFNKKRGNE